MHPNSYRIAPLLLVLALTAGACAPATRGLPAAPAPVAMEPEDLGEGPPIEAEVVVSPAKLLLGDVPYDLPLEANSWVEAELRFLVGERPAVIGRWLERGDFYEPFIKTILANEGLPTDLFHLAMIESGFVPTARSRAGAVGLWQFMPATGRAEGLRVDAIVDERMDPVRSTFAAARHLRSLHRQFGGDWALAAAAYNAGSGRIRRGLDGFGANNFWDLAVWGDLAAETQHYVPRLYAMTIIGRDRPRFGFGPREAARDAFAFDSVRVDLATPLATLATIGGLREDDLVRLNPHLLQRTTPPGTYWVWVPAGQGTTVQHAFLQSEFRRDGGMGTYVVRRGDSLNRIAQRSGVPASRIRELNRDTNWDRLQVGHRVRLPAAASRTLVARADEAEAAAPSPAASASGPAVASAPAQTPRPASARSTSPASSNGATAAARTEHRVVAGESLWSISRRYDVSVDAIREANGMKGETVVIGRTLRIPTTTTMAQNASAPSTAPVTAAAPAIAQVAVATEHVVRSGDTLWSIAREYGATVDSIQTANRIENNVILPGQRLTIPR
jgi:membrane-bound lytic murein transglycosylase D